METNLTMDTSIEIEKVLTGVQITLSRVSDTIRIILERKKTNFDYYIDYTQLNNAVSIGDLSVVLLRIFEILQDDDIITKMNLHIQNIHESDAMKIIGALKTGKFIDTGVYLESKNLLTVSYDIS